MVEKTDYVNIECDLCGGLCCLTSHKSECSSGVYHDVHKHMYMYITCSIHVVKSK